MTSPIIFTNVSKRYSLEAKSPAVADFSLKINAGEFFCLVGPSGCGKSTVLKMVAGLELPSFGQLTKPDDVSMVFQSGALLPWLTVEDNVAFGLRMRGVLSSQIAQSVHGYLRMVGLGEFRREYPRELSGGQRQRVGIARALAVKPSILLLDEPFSALDQLTAEELCRDLLEIWQKTQITILMVSHLLEEAVILSDRVGVMKEGRLRGVVEIDLPRPRENKGKAISWKLVQIRRLLS